MVKVRSLENVPVILHLMYYGVFGSSLLIESTDVYDMIMHGHTSKCRQMFISRKRAHSIASPSLTIDGTPLIEVTEYKYLYRCNHNI